MRLSRHLIVSGVILAGVLAVGPAVGSSPISTALASASVGNPNLPPGAQTLGNNVTVIPTLSRQGIGYSGSFTVNFISALPGPGEILFGSGPGCLGLVETATYDTGSASNHSITVTGNDLSGTVGNVGIQPGATYYFEVATLTAQGLQIDNNGGKCYSITIPKP